MLLAALAVMAGSAWGAETRTNRADSTVFVGVTPIGLHIATLLTTPVGAGIYFGDNWLAGGEYGAKTFDLSGDGEDEAELTFTNLGAYVRWFPNTNSFNVGAALHRRTSSGTGSVEVTDESTGQTADVEVEFDAEVLVGSLILGNQWIMDFGMVLSLDWVVLSGALSSSSSGTVKTRVDGQPVTTGEEKEAEEALEDLGDLTNLFMASSGLFVFTIGWAF